VTLLGPPSPTTTTSSTSSSATSTSISTTTDAISVPTPTDHSVLTSPQDTSDQAAKSKVGETESNGVNVGPIVGGVVGGVIFLALISLAIWFFLRRRKQRKHNRRDHLSRDLTPMLGSNGVEKFAMDHSPEFGENGEERRSGGVFGPFGGRC